MQLRVTVPLACALLQYLWLALCYSTFGLCFVTVPLACALLQYLWLALCYSTYGLCFVTVPLACAWLHYPCLLQIDPCRRDWVRRLAGQELREGSLLTDHQVTSQPPANEPPQISNASSSVQILHKHKCSMLLIVNPPVQTVKQKIVQVMLQRCKTLSHSDLLKQKLL